MQRDEIGPHLLGRVPRPPDPKDYKMRDHRADESTLDRTMRHLDNNPRVPVVVKRWAREVTRLLDAAQPTPPPAPPPDPTPTPDPGPTPDPNPPEPAPGDANLWEIDVVLDQGQTPHCVGFGWAGWEACAPVMDTVTNADGDAIYYACKIIDGEPGAEDGSDVRSGAKVMKNQGKLSVYVFADHLQDALDWVLKEGPVVVGTDWTNDMFDPDPDGVVTPSGTVAGGHCYLMIGYDHGTGLIEFQNSWGSEWGVNGRFFMHSTDFEMLFSNQGDACAAAEI